MAALVALMAATARLATAADPCVTASALSAALQGAVASADFGGVWDRATNASVHALPNVDVAVIALQRDCPAAVADVLLSRDFPGGLAKQPSDAPGDDWSIVGIDWRWWDYPRWDSPNESAWTAPPAGDWFGRIAPHRTRVGDPVWMVPHPASSFKTMLAAGLMICVEEGSLSPSDDASLNNSVFPDATARYVWQGSLGSALEAMLQVSDNAATTAVISALHRAHMLPDRLMGIFAGLGLHTLQLNGTLAGGYWGGYRAQRNRSSEYDTTGFFHMTAFDAARLMWLIDPAPPVPAAWNVGKGNTTRQVTADSLMNATSRHVLYDVLLGQAWHDTLSTTAICGRPGRHAGIPSQEPSQWIQRDGRVIVNDTGDVETLTNDVWPCQTRAEVTFAHKTGLTNTFGSALGIVDELDGGDSPRHYIIALFSNLGIRFTDVALAARAENPCAAFSVCYTQRIPSIAHAIDSFLALP